jgi:hypothetical protein
MPATALKPVTALMPVTALKPVTALMPVTALKPVTAPKPVQKTMLNKTILKYFWKTISILTDLHDRHFKTLLRSRGAF